MTHYKWLVAKRNREEAEEYALRIQNQERYDYCEVQESLGTVEEIYEALLREGVDGRLAKKLRMNGILVEDKPEWLRKLVERGKSKFRVYVIDCHD
jgi:hypothetical protein